MNDEIKEILDRLEYIVFNEIIDYGEELSLSECKSLLDYITNLQQENERLKAIWKDTNVIVKDNKTLVMNTNAYDTLEDYKKKMEILKEELFKSVNNTNNSMELTEDYKQRIDKASELINKQKKKMYKSRNKIAMFILIKLENILQNGDDSQ